MNRRNWVLKDRHSSDECARKCLAGDEVELCVEMDYDIADVLVLRVIVRLHPSHPTAERFVH